jgi:hypothetical protein
MVYDLAAESTRVSVTSTPPVEDTVTVVALAVVTAKRTTLRVADEVLEKSRVLEVIAVAATTAEVAAVCEATFAVVPFESEISTPVIVDADAGAATRPVRARAAAAATAISFLDI